MKNKTYLLTNIDDYYANNEIVTYRKIKAIIEDLTKENFKEIEVNFTGVKIRVIYNNNETMNVRVSNIVNGSISGLVLNKVIEIVEDSDSRPEFILKKLSSYGSPFFTSTSNTKLLVDNETNVKFDTRGKGQYFKPNIFFIMLAIRCLLTNKNLETYSNGWFCGLRVSKYINSYKTKKDISLPYVEDDTLYLPIDN